MNLFSMNLFDDWNQSVLDIKDNPKLKELLTNISSDSDLYTKFQNTYKAIIFGKSDAIDMHNDLVKSVNDKFGENYTNSDDVAKLMIPIIAPMFTAMNSAYNKKVEKSTDKYCRMDEYEFYGLPYKKQIQLQSEWGRKLYLVATNVNLMEQCDIESEYLAFGMGDVYNVIVKTKNIHQGKEWKECTEYGDIYIYATEEEIKRFIKALEDDKENCDEWFGPYYKLASY